MNPGSFVRRGTTLYLAEEAIEAILNADRSGKRVLGIDGFVLKGVSTQPDLEHSSDYSTVYNQGENTNQEAIRFIQEREHLGLHFEVVLDADDVDSDP